MGRALLTSVLVLAGACAVPQASETGPEARPPNLVLIVTDDQGWWDVGFNGCTDIPTPHIDRIAREGVRFESGYASHCVCGPSRAGLMTGRYQDRFGANHNPTIDPSAPNNGLPTSERTIAELLSPRGYATMAVGKWHLGTHPDLAPRRRGFDEFYGFLSGGHAYFPEQLELEDLSEVDRRWAWYRTKLLHNGRRVATDAYLTDELSDAAVDFVVRMRDRPFFLYLAYNAPHTPLQATARYLERFEHIEDERRRTYAAMVSAVDDGVGRLLGTLDELGLAEETLVVFLSDNGGSDTNGAINLPLRGHKGSLFEGGVRVPFAMRWTGTLPAGLDYDHPVIALDVAATICAQAGVEVPNDRPLDGVDLLPFLTGARPEPPHDALYWRNFYVGRGAIRAADDKLIRAADGALALYDLAADREESIERSGKAAERAEELRRLYAEWVEPMVPPISPPLGSWTFDE